MRRLRGYFRRWLFTDEFPTYIIGVPRPPIYYEKAISIRLQTKSDRIGNSYSNMSSTLLRKGLPDQAEEMLAR